MEWTITAVLANNKSLVNLIIKLVNMSRSVLFKITKNLAGKSVRYERNICGLNTFFYTNIF